MSEYIKKTWQNGEVITADGLNNLETGVSEAKKEAAAPQTSIDKHIKDTGNPHNVTLDQVLGEDPLPVEKGGHGAADKKKAKTNLGIFYGTEEPTDWVDGDIWLKPIE